MSLSSRKSIAGLSIALVAVLAANVYVFLNRGWEDSVMNTDYASLYYPIDAPSIRGWDVDKSHVMHPDLVWNKDPAGWDLLIDGKPAGSLPGGKPPGIKIREPLYSGATGGVIGDFNHKYTLRPTPAGLGPDLDFWICGISNELYSKGGMELPHDALYVVHTKVPIGDYKRQSVAQWVDDYHYLDAKSLADADRVVHEEMGIKDSDDTPTKIDKLVSFIHHKLEHAGGVPKDAFRWLDPWHIWLEMLAGTGKGWCTQYSQIYNFFASRAGVPSRFVFASAMQDNYIIYTGHSWAESWIKEAGKWAFVDPIEGFSSLKDRDGSYLNTVDLLNLKEHKAFDGLVVRAWATNGKVMDYREEKIGGSEVPVTVAPDGFATVPFSLVGGFIQGEMSVQQIIKYRRPPNVEDLRDVYSMALKDWTFTWVAADRYLFHPTLAYSTIPVNGEHIYFERRVLFGAFVALLVLLIVALVQSRKARHA